MHYSPSDFVSPDLILADVLPLVGESGDYKELPKGFYINQIQKALEALSFDTYFSKKTVGFAVPENLVMNIPKGLFNLRQMYLTNGDGCGIGPDSVVVYFKSNFFNDDGTGSGNYVARNKGSNKGNDPYYSTNKGTYLGNTIERDDRTVSNGSSDSIGANYNKDRIYFYNIQNGRIMFSSSCKHYANVIMEFNGLDTNVGDKPVIPLQFREVVIDWVVEAVLRVKYTRNSQLFAGAYNDAKGRLGRNPYNVSGTWHTATQRASSLDSKAREDMALYYSNFVK